jgi:hypothetical protein
MLPYKNALTPKIGPLYRRHIQKYSLYYVLDSCAYFWQSFLVLILEGFAMYRFFVKSVFWAQALLLAFLLGRFSYNDSDGYGIFIPNLGGYHVSLTDNADSGIYN